MREARIEDLEALVDLLAEGSGGREGGDLAPYAAAFAKVTADRGQVQAVAELGGQVVGMLQLSIVPGLAGRGLVRAQIEGVHTLSSLRGRGIGDELFAWAVAEAGRRGAAVVHVAAGRDRVNEHRYYAHLGFDHTHLGFTKNLR